MAWVDTSGTVEPATKVSCCVVCMHHVPADLLAVLPG